MKQMTEILQKSDFIFRTSFIDLLGNNCKVKAFKFSYSTMLSAPITAQYDGINYINCKPYQNGIEVLFERPKFNVGQIKVIRELTIESVSFEGGTRHITQVDYIPYTIVTTYSNAKPESVKPVETTADQAMIFIETLAVEAINGKDGVDGVTGPKGDGGIDLTIAGEQIVPGEFFLGKDGTRKQVYIKTVSGTSVWWWNEGNCSLIDIMGGNVDTIHSYGGMTYKEGVTTRAIVQNWALRYAPQYNSIAILTFNQSDLPLKHHIWVKYTRLN